MLRHLSPLFAGLLLALAPAAAAAAPGDWVDAVAPIATPATGPALPLGPAPAAGAPAEGWAGQGPGERIAYNIGQAQLLPVPGTTAMDHDAPAVLLVPGGGFQFLAMDNEGFDVARRLDRLGYRVFIVKYRTLPIPGGFPGFKAELARLFRDGGAANLSTLPLGAADTAAAIRLVRARAAQFHVRADRIGVLGFSAGAMTVLAMLQADAPDARADFAGLIYGPTAGTRANVPTGAPPLFAAIAADDRFFKTQDLGLLHAWRQAGKSVELHLYSGGGHGFASHPNGTTSDAWFDQFALWLKAGGFAP